DIGGPVGVGRSEVRRLAVEHEAAAPERASEYLTRHGRCAVAAVGALGIGGDQAHGRPVGVEDVGRPVGVGVDQIRRLALEVDGEGGKGGAVDRPVGSAVAGLAGGGGRHQACLAGIQVTPVDVGGAVGVGGAQVRGGALEENGVLLGFENQGLVA